MLYQLKNQQDEVLRTEAFNEKPADPVGKGWRWVEYTPPPPPEPTYEERLAKCYAERRQAYVTEADPLFFKEQRGEVPAGTWLAKALEIKLRIPKP